MLDLLSEQNELVRENNQLLGEMLGKLDTLVEKPAYVNVQPGGTVIDATTRTSVKNILNEGKVDRGPAPQPDQKLLDLMTFGTDDISEWEIGTPYEISHFWPTGKSNPGWVRVSIKHPSDSSLRDRIAKGCLCGRPIVLKEHNGESFYSCEALTQKGSCPYRPAAYFDKMTFLMNLPPQK